MAFLELKSVGIASLAAGALAAPTWALAQAGGAGAPPPAAAQAQPQPQLRPKSASTGDAKAPSAVEGVIVTAPSSQGVKASIDRLSYSLSKDLHVQSGSIADVLRNIPSVDVDVQGNVSLRGDPNVTILIDGQPSGMFKGEGRGQMLQQLPASQIERVEVMTNPSAAFSPEGTAGIINLITKQNRGVGLVGSLKANVGNGGRNNGGISLSHNARDLTVSGDAGWRRDAVSGTLDDERHAVDQAGGVSNTRQATRFKSEGDSTNVRGAVDYDLTSTTRIGGELRYNDMDFDSKSFSSYDTSDGAGLATQGYDRSTQARWKKSVEGLSTNARRKFSGTEHDLSINFSIERTLEDQDRQTLMQSRLPVAPDSYEVVRNGTDLVQTHLKAEYRKPLASGDKLVAGYEGQIDDNTYNNYGARGADAGSLIELPGLTNRFEYRQTVQAVYATYQHMFGKLTALGGLRVESAEIDTHQVTSGTGAGQDYVKAYPSLHLTYALSLETQVTGSYSRRIQRPAAQDLNPYVTYQDPYNFRQGNPDLNPQITDSFEMGLRRMHNGAFYMANLYYRRSRDGVTDISRDLGGGVLLTTKENLARGQNVGVELVVTGKLSKKLSYNVSGNAFWNEIESPEVVGDDSRSGVSFMGRGNLNWQATPKDFFQINTFAIGKRITPQGWQAPTGMLNLGYQHRFNPKIAAIVTVQDALKTFGSKTYIDTPTLRDVNRRDFDLRAVYVGVTYSLGGANRNRPSDPKFDFEGGLNAAGPR